MCYVHTTVSLKSAHEWSTLQVCQRGWWVLFRVFPHLTLKERSCHIYSDLMPLKQIIGQVITQNGAASSFEVCTQHSEPHHVTMAMQCSPMCVATLSTCTMQNCLIINLRWSTRCLRCAHSLRPYFYLDPMQEIGPKVGSGHSFVWLRYIYYVWFVCKLRIESQ